MRVKSTGPDRRTRTTVVARAEVYGHPRCERCGARSPEQIHHRKPRRRGGSADPAINSPANLVALCANCHTQIESNRTGAYAEGWLLHQLQDPAATAVLYRGRFALLDDTGRVTTEGSADAHDW